MSSPNKTTDSTNEQVREALCLLRKMSSKNKITMLEPHVVDIVSKRISLGVFLTWCVFIATVHKFTPPDHFKTVGAAQNFEKLTAMVMFYSLINNILPRIIFYSPHQQQHLKKRSISGVLMLALTVQICAALSNGLMAWLPTPTYIDSMTNGKVYLVRWCEWIPLAFAMAFLTDAIDSPNLRRSLTFGATQSLSTVGGILLPFCPSPGWWCAVLTASLALFWNITFRVKEKVVRSRTIVRGTTVEDIENYERVQLSARLIVVAFCTWNLLVINYFVSWYLTSYLQIEDTSITAITESLVDLIAKHFYLSIALQAHDKVFNESARAERRLNELRNTMGIIWRTSSDILIISNKSMDGNTIRTQLSPAIYKLLQESKETENDNKEVEKFAPEMLVIEQTLLSSGSAGEEKESSEEENQNSDLYITSLNDIKKFIAKGWDLKKTLPEGESKGLLSHEIRRDEKKKEKTTDHTLYIEGNITFVNDDSFVVIARNVTERVKRFEAEKKIVQEHTARKKDNEINRFIRHEVKNGLLAAIGLCDDLRENIIEGAGSVEEKQIHNVKLDEIDTNLNQTLNIVSTQAMARDLINGVYAPRHEVIDISEIYNYQKKDDIKKGHEGDRFPIYADPCPFPLIEIDPAILNCVHRNAITNAMKYGEEGGLVETIFIYHDKEEKFELQVVNRPGHQHEDIMKLGTKKANEMLFSPGKSLHRIENRQSWDRSFSSGDGAWIMRQCANSIGGTCDIEFTTEKTIFRLIAPARNAGVASTKLSYKHRNVSSSGRSTGSGNNSFDSLSGALTKLSRRAQKQPESKLNEPWSKPVVPPKKKSTSNFSFPKNTWFIVIDDSVVQRKLLKRWLGKCKIPEDRGIVQGSTKEEIIGFTKFIVDLMVANPTDHVIIIADEIMDTVDEKTGATSSYSGSLMLEEIIRVLKEEHQDSKLESKLLALVRSANDSSQDIKLYTQRAHGFIPKNPMGKESMMNLIIELWFKRYPESNIFHSTKNL